MSNTTIANRYARALADVIIGRGETDEVVKELNDFAGMMAQHDQLKAVFASPVLPVDRKRAVLRDLLARLNLRQTSSNFVQLLLSYSRLHNLDQMLRALSREIDVRTNNVFAEVTTARSITEGEQAMLREKLKEATGKQVRLQFRTDPDIIGGVVTRIGSVVYDGSIRTQLAQMKQRLINS